MRIPAKPPQKPAALGGSLLNTPLLVALSPGAFAITVALWIFGGSLGINAVAAAIVGLFILLVTNVTSWKECLNNNAAWDTLTWFAALIAMAAALNKYGFIPWLSNTVVKVRCGRLFREAKTSRFNGAWFLCNPFMGRTVQPSIIFLGGVCRRVWVWQERRLLRKWY